ncbi:hypothetical protein ACJJTC_012694 [Scirpophaga incertulas]
MFDTERFINEIQSRPCLWNLKEKSYGDRNIRRQAWKQIAVIFYNEWDTLTPRKKNESIDNLVKKWKYLRDYYVREKKKGANIRSSSPTMRKRKKRIILLLQFLDVLQNKRSASNVKETSNEFDKQQNNSPNQDEQQYHSSDESLSSVSRRQLYSVESIPSFQRPLNNHIQGSMVDNDSDKQFLMSLLPEIKKLSEENSFQFRMDVMNLLRKYRFPYLAWPANPTCSKIEL